MVFSVPMCKSDSVKLAEQVLKIFTIIDDCSVKYQVQQMKAKIRTTINWVLRNVSWTRRTMSSCPFILAYFPSEHMSKRFCLGDTSYRLCRDRLHLFSEVLLFIWNTFERTLRMSIISSGIRASYEIQPLATGIFLKTALP